MSAAKLLCAALVLCVALPGAQPPLRAQTWSYPETRFGLVTLEQTRDSAAGMLRSVRFTGEAGMYAIRRDRDHRWNVAAGGAMDLYGAGRWNVQFETMLDLAVDPGNTIAFNPRAFIWYEGVLIGLAGDEEFWQFGYVHRCKHDVDNLELYETTRRYEQRSLILGSLMARWRHDPVQVGSLRVRPVVQCDAYILLQDQRFPVATRAMQPNVDTYLGSVRACTELEHPLAAALRLGAAIDVRATLHGGDPKHRAAELHGLVWDASGELRLDASGRSGTLRIFLRYESLHDSFIPPIPLKADLLLVGIRIF